MLVLISPFEVPVEADERFVAAWERGRIEGATLLRALRADVDFRFVGVARLDGPADAATAGGEMPFPSHPGRYEVAHEDGTPHGDGGVVLIDPFAVPDGADEAFLAAWDRARGALAGQRGYLGTRLHRSLGPADFRFVDLTRWSSPLMFARATARPEFRELAGTLPFASHPALYTAVAG